MPRPAPRYVLAALNGATGTLGSYRLRIGSERAQQWLTDNLGLVTDDNEHTVGGHTVDWCWAQQRWYVRLK